jgi:hypothetical protein
LLSRLEASAAPYIPMQLLVAKGFTVFSRFNSSVTIILGKMPIYDFDPAVNCAAGWEEGLFE